jgi:hypothetical protein
MPIELKLLDSPRIVRDKIVKAFVYELNRRANKSKIKAKLGIRTKTLIARAIMEQPEYGSLLSGRLYGEFGIPDADVKVRRLLHQWLEEFQIQVSQWRIVGPRIVGGFSVSAVRADFGRVLSMPEAHQLTEKHELLPWLKWLLLEGDKIIIREHYYARAPLFEKYSRTGRGIMISTLAGKSGSNWKKGLVSGGWRVPPQYSGTIDNNWITRALVGKGRAQGIRPELRKIFKQILREV